MNFPTPARVAGATLALASFSVLTSAQTVDLTMDTVPSYHPNGPDAPYMETFMEEPFTFEFSLPGLSHEDSIPVAGTWVVVLAYGVGTLPFPIPLSSKGELWLDPFQFIGTQVVSSSTLKLENLSVNPLDPLNIETTVPFQVGAIDLLDPLFEIQTSGLYEVKFERPRPPFPDQMRPLGATVGGTETVAFDAPNNRYTFHHDDGAGGITEYVLDLDDPDVAAGTIEITETTSGTTPIRNGGFFYTQGNGAVLYFPIQFQFLGSHVMTSHSVNGNTVTTEFQDTIPTLAGGQVVHNRRISYTLEGKSLKVRGEHLNGGGVLEDNFYAFGLGDYAASITSTFEEVTVPYMDQIGIALVDDQYFVSSFIDQFQSPAQFHEPALWLTLFDFARNTERQIYTPMSDGSTFALDETGWVTISDDVHDVFVESSAPKSNTAAMFEEHVAIAYSRENGPSNGMLYSNHESNLNRHLTWGLTDVTCWNVHWMRFGHNRRATTHTPVNPVGGTDADMTSFIQAATGAGWRMAMYTDFYSLDQAQGFDDNPNYSEIGPNYINYDDAVRNPDGSYKLGFGIAIDLSQPVAGNNYNTRLLAPRRAFNHFDREAAHMVDVYGVNANYYDVMTISSPDLVVTGGGQNQGIISGDVRSPNDRTIRDAINSYKNLYRDTAARVDGPIIAEGGFFDPRLRFDTMYAGYIDGAWRTLSTGDAPSLPGFSGDQFMIMPDYELQVVRPKMPGLFGMGQYPRFFSHQDPTITFPYGDHSLAEYRATEISYGHNGFFMSLSMPFDGQDFLPHAQQIKKYYTFRSLHTEWNATSSVTVEYGDAGGSFVDLSTAIIQDYDFVRPILRKTYDTGLEVVVNHTTSTFTYSGFDIPTHGWVIRNPSTGYLNISVLDTGTGNPIDQVVAPGYELGDGNGTAFDFGGTVGLTTDLKVVRTLPSALSLTENGDGSITIQ